MDRAVSMRLPTDLLERLTEQAAARRWTRSELIRKVLAAWCDAQDGVGR